MWVCSFTETPLSSLSIGEPVVNFSFIWTLKFNLSFRHIRLSSFWISIPDPKRLALARTTSRWTAWSETECKREFRIKIECQIRKFFLIKTIFSLTVGQTLSDLKHQASDFLSFLYQNKLLLIILLVGYCFVRLMIVFFLKIACSNKRHRCFPFWLLYTSDDQIRDHLTKWNTIGYLLLFFGLFKFVNLNLLAR